MNLFDVKEFVTVVVPLGALIGWFISRLDRKFEKVDQRFEHLEAKFDKKFEQLDSKIDNVEKQLNARIDGIRQDMNAMTTRLGRIEGSLHPFSWAERIQSDNENKKSKKTKEG